MPSVFENLTQESTQSEIRDAVTGVLLTADSTPALQPLDRGGVDVPAGAEIEVVPALGGRVQVYVLHAGTTGTLWLGFGETAQVGLGLALGPGGSIFPFTNCAVRVHNTGSASVRVTWQGFGL